MGLSEFIEANQEAILAALEGHVLLHAPAGSNLTRAEARDHADELLAQISAVMRQPRLGSGVVTAKKHGSARRAEGFDVQQVLGEYRMLRATIMRMWLGSRPALGTSGVEDLVSFNEAIDQAVDSSLSQFADEAKGARGALGSTSGHGAPAPAGARKRKQPK
jgi:hypothetical protein